MFPKIKTRRNNKRSLLKATKAFEPISTSDRAESNTCGNIQRLFEPTFDKNEKTGKYEHRGGIFKGKCFHEKVSAPYLLAKLVASYPGIDVGAEGQDGYKVTFWIMLRHKETGALLTFYDWKGASSFGSNVLPDLADSVGYASFKRDVEAMLKALADPHFPHPYDGCVIGEVA